MTELLALRQGAPLPSSWKVPQPAQGVPVGQHVARYLRQASQAVGAAVARIRPDAGARVPVLDPGPWEAPGSVTPGPAGWFALAVETGRSGFRLGGRPVAAADLAQAIWHCSRWRGRPVLLVTQRSASTDRVGPALHQLAVDLGAPVYASDAGIRFTFGRASTDGLFWCWRPGGGDEPEPAGHVLPPLGRVRVRPAPPGRVPGRPAPTGRVPARDQQPPSPVPSPATTAPGTAPSPVDPAVPSPVAAPEAGTDLPLGAAFEVQTLTLPVVELPRPDLGVQRMVLTEFDVPRLELDTCRPLVADPEAADPATSALAAVTLTASVPAVATLTGPDTTDAPAAGPVTTEAPTTGAATTDAPANGVGVGPPPVPPADRGAAWFGVRARTDEADRERLRTVLGWKFQAHSRTVARALSLHPGLRSAVGAHDVMAGLVTVLALLDGVGERVNGALRGGGTPDEDVQLLARCACAGLEQLPAVGGPVFAAVPAGLDVTRYRAGELLVEPAFTTVSCHGGSEGDAGRYAIWSATARRLDQLGIADGPGVRAGRAMFAAGSRFAVLGVDEGPDGAPYVLLREVVSGHRDGAVDERVAGKLRDALAAQPQRAAPAPLPWPLGLAAGDRPFALEPGPGGA
ncbi:hypothetical protein CA850_09755 [Micromonospora echinospora]|uniref:Uncharacterized protein n=1 Tax=Micromonospora echinospora TaxID=1877 RepID=A0A1C4XMY1_MICEC|nr:hypothetical protein [Micromonospora echinospora]OZV82537.1 hypothetical protein CA850_09755 [Micromonospora echinospora]SCF09682.1 hypothetical protein GA0070618_3188 [Micromonospora echinospora]